MNTLLDAALEYRKRGWSVLPTRDKRPALQSWGKYKETIPSIESVKEWFSRSEVTGVGVVCGPVSGNLVCRDYDIASSYTRWANLLPKLTSTLSTVRTPGDFHVYFRSSFDRIKKCGDGELRGGGFVLAPPSKPKDNLYEWTNPLTDSELPFLDSSAFEINDCVVERVEKVEERTEIAPIEKTGGLQNLPLELHKRILAAINATIPACEGERNKLIFEFARRLKSIPEFQNTEPHELRPMVKEWHRHALETISTKQFDET